MEFTNVFYFIKEIDIIPIHREIQKIYFLLEIRMKHTI